MDLNTYLKQQRGRAAKLAKSLGVSPVLLSQWSTVRQIPAERCPEIEELTERAVLCEEMRPDIKWRVLVLRNTQRAA